MPPFFDGIPVSAVIENQNGLATCVFLETATAAAIETILNSIALH